MSLVCGTPTLLSTPRAPHPTRPLCLPHTAFDTLHIPPIRPVVSISVRLSHRPLEHFSTTLCNSGLGCSPATRDRGCCCTHVSRSVPTSLPASLTRPCHPSLDGKRSPSGPRPLIAYLFQEYPVVALLELSRAEISDDATTVLSSKP